MLASPLPRFLQIALTIQDRRSLKRLSRLLSPLMFCAPLWTWASHIVDFRSVLRE